MSLINDALKRASQAKSLAPTSASPPSPLRPVEHRPSVPWRLVFLPVVLALLTLAGLIFHKGWQARQLANLNFIKLPVKARELNDSPKETPAKDPVTTRSMAGQVFTQPTQVQSKPLPPRPLLLASGVATNSSPDTNGPAPVTEPVKPSFPSVRLQGIFYRARNPSAVINAKSVFVGEKVAGAKVVAITRDSATLEWNGQTKLLTLE